MTLASTGLGQALLVGLGGFVGALARHGLAVGLAPWSAALPLGTLAANTLGCLVMGVLAGWPGFNGVVPETIRLALMVGFCGGFTTLSSLLLESGLGLRASNLWFALGYIGLTLVLGALALGLGYALARQI